MSIHNMPVMRAIRDCCVSASSTNALPVIRGFPTTLRLRINGRMTSVGNSAGLDLFGAKILIVTSAHNVCSILLRRPAPRECHTAVVLPRRNVSDALGLAVRN